MTIELNLSPDTVNVVTLELNLSPDTVNVVTLESFARYGRCDDTVVRCAHTRKLNHLVRTLTPFILVTY